MKKKLLRLLGLAMTTVMAAGSLTACGNDAAGTKPEGTDTAVEETAGTEETAQAEPAVGEETSSKKITINTQSGPGVEAAWKAVAEAYKMKNPDVEIVIDLKPTDGYGDWVQKIFATENPNTDIVNINLAGSAKTDKSVNFMEYADMDSPYSDGLWIDQFNYDMQVRDLGKGEWDALSLDSVQVVWLYNADIFAEVGVKPPATWNELIDVSEKLQAAGYQPISIAGDFNSFWAEKMGWLAQIYADQTTRSTVNSIRAQEGDYCYDPDIDGVWSYDPADPYNDDTWKVNSNPVRAFKAIADGDFKPDSEGMKTVWENFAKVFPKYAGGDAFFGTKDGIPLFYQGKAAMTVDGAWRLINYKNDMAKLTAGKEVTNSDAVIEGVKEFNLATFNMPSMEGTGIEAPARTIEVANGFLGAIKKDKEHDALVVDFLMYFSSAEGQSTYLEAGLATGEFVPNGPSLVYGVELPADIESMFDNLDFIGNCQKGNGTKLARGLSGSQGDIQESYRLFYDYSYNYLSGKTTIDEWLASHKVNVEQYLEEAMKTSGISATDLKNPQNEPVGQ